jgi:soluble lytic murein transglycosylase-like protein
MRLSNATLNHLQSTIWPALESGNGLPPKILNAVATWETRGSFDNDAFNRGSGARGIFQITPVALKQINIDTGMNLNPTNPYQASVAAATLLARASRLFSGELPLMLIAYNAGEGRAKKFIRAVAAEGSGQLPRETLDYVSNVTSLMG